MAAAVATQLRALDIVAVEVMLLTEASVAIVVILEVVIVVLMVVK